VKKLLKESASLRRLLESSEEELKKGLGDFSQHLSAVKSQPVTDRNPHKSASFLHSSKRSPSPP